MANISRNSYNETSQYDKVIQQQGMPMTDYDYNELQDIQRVKLRRVISELLGDGAVGTGWQITPGTGMQVNVLSGSYYLNGYRAVNVSNQTLTINAASGSARTDIIYLQVTESEIDSVADPSIKHPSLSIEPTRRTKITAIPVYAAGTTTVPANTSTTFYVLLGTLAIGGSSTSITSGMITDNRFVRPSPNSTNQTITNLTVSNLTVTGSSTNQSNYTFQPTAPYSSSQTNSIIHNPIYNSSGNNTAVAQVDFIRTSTTDGSYDGEISLKTRTTGGALTEAVRIKKDQAVSFVGKVNLPANPASNLEAATKQYVDSADTTNATNISTHTALTNTAHGATSAATASTLIARDSAGRAQVATPSAAGDIATKGYADGVRQDNTQAFVMEVRTTDPTSPVVGRIWYRSDLG